MITQALGKFKRSLVRVFGWKPAVGEFFTCWGGIGYVIIAYCSDNDAVSKSVNYLAQFGLSTSFWYALAAVGFAAQLAGLVFRLKWVRWFGAIMVASWWLNLAQALTASSEDLVPVTALFCAVSAMNMYVIMHLLWEE